MAALNNPICHKNYQDPCRKRFLTIVSYNLNPYCSATLTVVLIMKMLLLKKKKCLENNIKNLSFGDLLLTLA
jgi:hypothetical protein